MKKPPKNRAVGYAIRLRLRFFREIKIHCVVNHDVAAVLVDRLPKLGFKLWFFLS